MSDQLKKLRIELKALGIWGLAEKHNNKLWILAAAVQMLFVVTFIIYAWTLFIGTGEEVFINILEVVIWFMLGLAMLTAILIAIAVSADVDCDFLFDDNDGLISKGIAILVVVVVAMLCGLMTVYTHIWMSVFARECRKPTEEAKKEYAPINVLMKVRECIDEDLKAAMLGPIGAPAKLAYKFGAYADFLRDLEPDLQYCTEYDTLLLDLKYTAERLKSTEWMQETLLEARDKIASKRTQNNTTLWDKRYRGLCKGILNGSTAPCYEIAMTCAENRTTYKDWVSYIEDDFRRYITATTSSLTPTHI